MNSEAIKVRPSLSETSDWDEEAPRFEAFGGILHPPGSIQRHQVIRGQSLSIKLDWVVALQDYTSTGIYANIRIATSKELGAQYWINRTVPSSEQTIDIDLDSLTNEQTGLPIWVSAEGEYVSPVVTVILYAQDPNDCEDMAEHIRNLLYTDVFYLRAEIDSEYMDSYYARQENTERVELQQRKLMCVLGAAMIVTGLPAAIWGLDMIISSTTGKSMFDHAAHFLMRASGKFSEDYINSFSFMHFTSDKTVDMILQEIVAEGISMGVGALARGASLFKAGFKLGGELGEGLISSLGTGLRTNILGAALRVGALTSKGVGARITTSVIKIVASCAMEAVMELAFDAVTSENMNERPDKGFFGEAGMYMFFGVMTASVILGGFLGKKGVFSAVGTDFRPPADLVRMSVLLQLSMQLMSVSTIIGYMQAGG